MKIHANSFHRSARETKSSQARCNLNPATGFTLIEVILALAIAIGMMVIVLFFYRQAADLRNQVLRQTEEIAAARLLMDRITSDLRAARWHEILQKGVVGGSDYIQFVKTDIPSPAAWEQVGFVSRPVRVESDLKAVGYFLGQATGDSNAPAGLVRWEETLLEKPVAEITNSQPFFDVSLEEESTSLNDTNQTVSKGPQGAISETVAVLHYLRFRYWDGFVWWDYWDNWELPLGIEVTLGAEPMPTETEAGDTTAPTSEVDLTNITEPAVGLENEDQLASSSYPFETFRRVIYLPASKGISFAEDPLDATGEAMLEEFPLP